MSVSTFDSSAETLSCCLSFSTLHIHQDSSSLRDDQRAGSNVPDVDPDLIIRFNTPGRNQTHVDRRSSCPAYPGNIRILIKLHNCVKISVELLQKQLDYPCTGMQRMFLRLEKILSTASGSLLDPNSVATIVCLMSDRKKRTWVRFCSLIGSEYHDIIICDKVY